MLHLGIDLGGTKIEGAVLDDHLSVLHRERMPTEAASGYGHILSRVASMRDRLVDWVHEHAASACIGQAGPEYTLGVGTPGAPSHRTGLLRNSNTLALNGRPLAADLAQRLDHSLRLENDANCFALAEATLGAGRGQRLVFGVIMGTGCGGGLVIDGQLHVGRNAIGGEWGHMSIDPAGPPCYCGQRGCVETFVSGSGVEARFAESTGKAWSTRAIVAGAESGDPRCRAALDVFYGHFGRALANVIDILDPDIVVLGGGLSNIDDIASRGRDAVAACTFTDAFDTPIVRHRLGDSAGVIGAAILGAANAGVPRTPPKARGDDAPSA